jgi:hypothetical protein
VDTLSMDVWSGEICLTTYWTQDWTPVAMGLPNDFVTMAVVINLGLYQSVAPIAVGFISVRSTGT